MASLIPWRTTGDVLEQFRHEMSNVMDRFFGPTAAETGNGGKMTWSPRVDIEETDKELLVKADLPGVEPKNVEITVRDGMLTLKGERKEEREKKEKTYHRVERFVGSFYREIPLPSGTDPDKISAETAKGVITISIPKKPEAQPKKIAVKAHE